MNGKKANIQKFSRKEVCFVCKSTCMHVKFIHFLVELHSHLLMILEKIKDQHTCLFVYSFIVISTTSGCVIDISKKRWCQSLQAMYWAKAESGDTVSCAWICYCRPNSNWKFQNNRQWLNQTACIYVKLCYLHKSINTRWWNRDWRQEISR